jgi:hypothetical protein
MKDKNDPYGERGYLGWKSIPMRRKHEMAFV